MDDRSRTVLSATAYAGCAAAAANPLMAWYSDRLPLEPKTLLGAAGFVAVPILFFLAQRCARTTPNTLRLRVLTLLQAPFALLACWGFRDFTMCALLVVFAAQLPPRLTTRSMIAVLLITDAALAWLVSPRLDWSGLGSLLLGYGSFQAFAVIVVSYALRTELTRDNLLLINAELLATRKLLAESARSEERLRLSRELHDVVGHKLTALKLQLRLCARDVPAPLGDSVGECMRLSDELLSDVRGVVSALRADEGIDLHAALTALVPAVPRPAIRLQLAADARVPGVEQAQALLRCAQEGITNALRHSNAEHIDLKLKRAGDGVSLSVEDDGNAQAPPPWGNGLNGMRERLQALGGVLEVAVNGRHGLRVNAWLPLPAGTGA